LLFVAGFDIAQHIGSWGISGAFDLEADSLPVGLADILVGNSIRCASAFERGRVGKVLSLCRCPISGAKGNAPSFSPLKEYRIFSVHVPLLFALRYSTQPVKRFPSSWSRPLGSFRKGSRPCRWEDRTARALCSK